jgi:hypothetical protein
MMNVMMMMMIIIVIIIMKIWICRKWSFLEQYVFRRYAANHLNVFVLCTTGSPSLTEQFGAAVPTGLAVSKCPVQIANTATSISCQIICGFLQCIGANSEEVPPLGP